MRKKDEYLRTLSAEEIAEIEKAISDMNSSTPKKVNFNLCAKEHEEKKTAVIRRRNTKRLNNSRSKREAAKARKIAAKKQYKEQKAVKFRIAILKDENLRIDGMLYDATTESAESLQGLKSENTRTIRNLSYSISRHNR